MPHGKAPAEETGSQRAQKAEQAEAWTSAKYRSRKRCAGAPGSKGQPGVEAKGQPGPEPAVNTCNGGSRGMPSGKFLSEAISDLFLVGRQGFLFESIRGQTKPRIKIFKDFHRKITLALRASGRPGPMGCLEQPRSRKRLS